MDVDDIHRHYGMNPGRPLIVSDIDEVVFEFLTPFDTFLRSRDYHLVADSFKLHGNVRRLDDGSVAPVDMVDELQDVFFDTQDRWQTSVNGAHGALTALSGIADIVFLTAMPPRYRPVRQRLLDTNGFAWPMIATEEAKGPVVSRLAENRSAGVVFLDDIFHNLDSVRDHVPGCLLINIMANQAFRALLPSPGKGIAAAADWKEAENLIRTHLSD